MGLDEQTAGQRFLGHSYVRTRQELSLHGLVLPLIAAPHVTCDPNLRERMERLAKIIDGPSTATSEEIEAIRNFVSESRPFVRNVPGSVKNYEKQIIEIGTENGVECVYRFCFQHAIGDNSVLTHMSLDCIAARLRAYPMMSAQEVRKLPVIASDSWLSTEECRALFVEPDTKIRFDLSLFKTHTLGISSPFKESLCRAIWLGSTESSRIRDRDFGRNELGSILSKPSYPIILSDHQNRNFVAPLEGAHRFVVDDSRYANRSCVAETIVSLEPAAGDIPKHVLVNHLGPERVCVYIYFPKQTNVDPK